MSSVGGNLYQLGLDVLAEAGEDALTTTFFAPQYLYPAINGAKDDVLAEVLETHERYRTLLHTADTPTLLSVGAGNGTDPPGADLPVNFVRLVRAQVLSTTRWVTITEDRKSEAQAGSEYPNYGTQLGGRTTYEIVGRKILLDPPPTGVVANNLKLWYEHDIPDLLFGTQAADPGATNLLRLASTFSNSIGQRPAEPIDDIYNAMEIEIVAGTGIGQRKRVTDYDGVTRELTLDSVWTTPPTIAGGSRYALLLPFPRMMARLVRYLACADIVETADEDASGKYAKYERARDNWISVLDMPTPGQRAVMPFDLIADLD